VIKTIRKIFVFGLFLSTASVFAQVAPSVTGGEAVLMGGGEVSGFSPDYGTGHLLGLGATFDLDFTPKIGMVGEARWLHFHNNADGGETQSDYLLGGKYRVWRYKKFDFDAKFLVGGVWITFPLDIGTGSYFAYAPGGFVDYRLSKRFRARGGYEWQILPSAPNIPGQSNNGLQPHGWTAGIEYTILTTH
jgi:hypothetical protein